VALGLPRNFGAFRQPLLQWLNSGAGEVVKLYRIFMINGIMGFNQSLITNILLHTKEAFQHSIGALNNIYNGFRHSETKEVRTPRRAKAEAAKDNDCAATNWIISC
jgi:hypothetical protein